MKNWKISIITILCFFAIGSTVLLTSCEQDPCVDLDCKNGGTCSDGYCQCPVGFEGSECEIITASRFVGTYAGNVKCNTMQGPVPTLFDTIQIELVEDPNKVTLKLGFGNTSVLDFVGTAETPETHFTTEVSGNVTIHAYVTVDGDLIAVYLESIDRTVNYRQICKFTGTRIRTPE